MPSDPRRPIIWTTLGVLVGLLVVFARQTAHALPEYAARTGQPCSTCHVNPAGGGPRTERAALWVAQGKPDQVPPLPGGGQQAGASAPDSPALPEGRALYKESGCAGCHGPEGEGGMGPAMNQPGLTADGIVRVIREGQGIMPAYQPDSLADTELEALVQVVLALGSGDVEAGPIIGARPLPPAQLACQGSSANTERDDCGGN